MFKVENILKSNKAVLVQGGHYIGCDWDLEFHIGYYADCTICNQKETKMPEIDPDKFLYAVNDADEDTIFVLDNTLLGAVNKWRQRVVDMINGEISNPAERITVEEIGDPDSVSLIGEPEQLVL